MQEPITEIYIYIYNITVSILIYSRPTTTNYHRFPPSDLETQQGVSMSGIVLHLLWSGTVPNTPTGSGNDLPMGQTILLEVRIVFIGTLSKMLRQGLGMVLTTRQTHVWEWLFSVVWSR